MRPVVPHPLGHLEPERARHEDGGLVGLEVVEVRPALTADLEEIAKALGGDQAGRGAAMLDQGVGGDRGAVSEIADGLGRAAGRGAQAVDDPRRDRQ